MTNTITLNLTLEELKTLDKFVELNDETRPLFDKIRNAYPKPETLLDVIRNLGYSYDMCYEIVDAVEEFEKSKEPEEWDIKVETDYLTGKARHKWNIVDKDGNDYKPTPQEPEDDEWTIDKLQEKNWYVDAKTNLKSNWEPKSKEPEENEWKSVALRFGEKLSGYLSDGYYELSPAAWFRWAVFTYGKTQQVKDAVRESVKWCEEHPNENPLDYLKPQTPEQVDAGLRNAMRQAKKEGVFDEPTKPMNEVLDRLENKYENDVSENKQKPKTLYDILYRWWMDIFCNPIYRDWDMETSIEDLVDRIEFWNMRIKNDDEVKLDEQENDKNFKNSLDLIREWGEKNKPPTLYEIFMDWWINHLDMEQSDEEIIDGLVNIIDKKFIPPSHDTNDYQWNKCLKIMRDKLR